MAAKSPSNSAPSHPLPHVAKRNAPVVDMYLYDIREDTSRRQTAWEDVRDEAACRALATEAATRGGSLDLWVNNAGVLVTGPSWTQDEATRRTMLEVNALGTMNGGEVPGSNF